MLPTTDFSAILAQAEATGNLDRNQIIRLLMADGDEQAALFAAADRVRRRYVGDEVHLRGLIEFSNYCSNDCHYCGLRRSNRRLVRYRLSPDEIIAAADVAVSCGYRTVVLQSGEDPYYSAAQLGEIIRRIKAMGDIAVTMSIGLRPREDYVALVKAGMDRYLMKQETADPVLFSKLRPGTTLAERLAGLRFLQDLGVQIGSGFMVGLPGQSVTSLADDILLLKELRVDMAGIGPFIPHDQTPLANYPAGDAALTLRAVAVARLVLRDVHLPATTALATVCPRGQEAALACGANVIMPNATFTKYRQLYQIYPNKAGIGEEPAQTQQRIVTMLQRLGRPIAAGRGDSPRLVCRRL